jgi:hypothetical protein
LRIVCLVNPCAQAIEFEEHVTIEEFEIFVAVTLRRTCFGFAAFIGMSGNGVRSFDEHLSVLFGSRTYFPRSKAYGEWIGIDADRLTTSETRFHQHRATAAKWIENDVASARKRFDQPPRRERMHTRRVAVKAMYMGTRRFLCDFGRGYVECSGELRSQGGIAL